MLFINFNRLRQAAGIGAAAMLLAAMTANPADAKWVAPEDIPVTTLKKTIGDYLKAHPNDANATYLLGRIYSAAFAQNTDKVGVYHGAPLPQYPSWSQVTSEQRSAALTAAARDYYSQALKYYSKAVVLNPKNGLAHLGLGFQCEQGLRYPALWPVTARQLHIAPTESALRARALAGYRKAFALTNHADSEQAQLSQPGPISEEAAESIVRLQTGRRLSAPDKQEVATMQAVIADFNSRPRRVTPILIDFAGRGSLPGLLAPGSHVRFDLAGDAIPRDWPWVRPDTGILVWDPKGTGRIESGLQLFGTVTWWMFWRDGYAPLAALDVDHNGWLEGGELKGIAVWFDRNGDGVSQPGEVVSLDSLGVRRIGVRAEGRRDGALWSSAGIEMADGRQRASYDWTPRSLEAR